MTDRPAIEGILAANRYCVIGSTDASGAPWVTPVFFAPLDADRICWVSSPDARHSRNIASRAAVAITVFDSTVAVGSAEAAYFDAEASPVPVDQVAVALLALNRRLPEQKQLEPADLEPEGPLVTYQAVVRHRYVLVRGGDPVHGNTLDMSLEV